MIFACFLSFKHVVLIFEPAVAFELMWTVANFVVSFQQNICYLSHTQLNPCDGGLGMMCNLIESETGL